MKLNKKPMDYVRIVKKKETQYDKYLNDGEFSREDFLQLLKKSKSLRKKELINAKPMITGKGYNIKLKYSDGIYILYIYVSKGVKRYSNIFDEIEKMFELTRTEIDKETYFTAKFDGFSVLTLRDLFMRYKSKEDKRVFDGKMVPSEEYLRNEAGKLITKVNAFFLILEKIKVKTDKLKSAERLVKRSPYAY